MTPPNLRTVRCCANCNHHGGWLDNMWCSKHDVETRPSLICDDHALAGEILPSPVPPGSLSTGSADGVQVGVVNLEQVAD